MRRLAALVALGLAFVVGGICSRLVQACYNEVNNPICVSRVGYAKQTDCPDGALGLCGKYWTAVNYCVYAQTSTSGIYESQNQAGGNYIKHCADEHTWLRNPTTHCCTEESITPVAQWEVPGAGYCP